MPTAGKEGVVSDIKNAHDQWPFEVSQTAFQFQREHFDELITFADSTNTGIGHDDPEPAALKYQKYTRMSTHTQYDQVIGSCKELFLHKTRDYGTSWRVLRTISVADQLFIKAQRIRTIQQHKTQRIGDSISSEFTGIVNYSVIGLIQLELGTISVEDLPMEQVEPMYDRMVSNAKKLMLDKNHDYGEAWRDMSQESFADLIMVKLLRIRQILANDGRTTVSEGIASNLTDILNYAVFALILIGEGKHSI